MSLVHMVVLSSAILSFGPRSRRWPAMLPLVALLAAMACVFIDCGLNRTILTLVGVPSIVSIVIVVDYAIGRGFQHSLLSNDDRRILLWYLAVASLIFYPSALGVIQLDFYRAGFNAASPGVLAAIGIALAFRRRYSLALVILLALVALDLRLLPSANPFDYVIDPVGGLIACGWVAVRVTKLAMARLRQPVPADDKAPALELA